MLASGKIFYQRILIKIADEAVDEPEARDTEQQSGNPPLTLHAARDALGNSDAQNAHRLLPELRAAVSHAKCGSRIQQISAMYL